jgi:ribosomal protein L14E/L6E/L27E
MALFDVGRVCRKTRGRDAWSFCVITGKHKGGFTVAGSGFSDEKVSGSHLEPTPWKVAAKDINKELAELKLA